MKTLYLLILITYSLVLSAQNTGINQVDATGKKQGKWIKYYNNGVIKYEGTFINDKPTGLLKRYYSTGVLRAAMNFTGDNESKAVLYYENKNIAAEGNYINSKKDSTWVFYSYYENGI